MAKPTRFDGSAESFQIFNDDFFESAVTPMVSHAPMPAVSKAPKRPLSSTSNNSNNNLVFNPPSSSSARYSPIKPTRNAGSPLAPLNQIDNNKLGGVTMAPPTTKGSSTDSLQKRPYLSKFKTVAQKSAAGNDMSFGFGKENANPHQPQLFPAPPTFNFENYLPPQKGPGKRMLMEAAPIKEARPLKKAKAEEGVIPAHDSFPAIADDGAKPGHSYAQLIGMAILRSPTRRLTLAQIYKWISDTFRFYKAEEAGWQNSIRHNLSLHKAFVKVERPKDDPGKGNYWTIKEGMEQQFIKDKPARKTASTAENLPVMSTRLEPSRPFLAPHHHTEPALPPPAPAPVPMPMAHSLPPLPTSQATLPAEVSSDATIPVSDPAAPEDANDNRGDPELPMDRSAQSPLPPAMHSSPPVPRRNNSQSRTPPPVGRVPTTSSAVRSHKRKFASMDDSGYISSLESSVMRPNQKAPLLTSEADRPRSKRSRGNRDGGRAEVEIARLRASSYDSPSKGRSFNALVPQSSSPFRGEGQMLPPLTPAMKLRPAHKAPPSASPNTNLQIHRDHVRAMLQSPLRKMTGIDEESTPWSPAFNLETSIFDLNDSLGLGDFSVFQDMDDAFSGTPAFESPCKKSAKRPRIDRSQSTNALADKTSAAKNALSITSTPMLKLPAQGDPIAWETPSKVFGDLGSSPSKPYGAGSPSKMPSNRKVSDIEDWAGDNLFPNVYDQTAWLAEDTENFNLDICQGFEKIGSNTQANKPKNNASKPPLGRSFTSQF